MAITLLRTKIEGANSNLMFETTTIAYGDKEITVVTATPVDDNLKAIGEPNKYEIDYLEQEFHTNLRAEAAEREHLITSHSTDPEWSPEGYIKNLEDELSKEQEGS